MTLAIGAALNNRYTLAALIGQGAMGQVYRATDAQTGQDVAVKVIAPYLAFDAGMLERFRREGEALRQLRHPNIVGFVDMFAHAGQQMIVMEYVPGGSLHDLLKHGPLPLERARRMALGLCDALTRAHDLSIVHRDLKPENVLVAEDGAPRLTDFGVARLLSGGTRLTGTGTQVGTPYYMSPEAWEGKPLDAQSDIWSLGVVLYEMLAGEVPFGGDTAAAVMTKVLMSPLPDLRQLRDDIPSGWVAVIARMLTRDRAERYTSMRRVAADLESGVAVVTTAVPLVSTGKISPRRKLGLAWVLGGSAILVLLVVGGLVWRGNMDHVAATQTVPDGILPATVTPRSITRTPGPSVTPLPPVTSTPYPVVVPLSIGSTQISPADGMVLLYVPAGDFVMGSKDSDLSANADEKPQHTVYLDAFWIDRTEVTQGMYAACVATGQCQPPRNTTGGDDYPVINVDWNDAGSYCAWAGRRLPTEAEWEKAARGPDARLYPWGNQFPSATLANFDEQVGNTAEVGQYPDGASPYGALDMAGNVWEWVNDWYAADYYIRSPASNPPGPTRGVTRVVRGGGWYGATTGLRAAFRNGFTSVFRDYDLGFRCARSLTDGEGSNSATGTPTPTRRPVTTTPAASPTSMASPTIAATAVPALSSVLPAGWDIRTCVVGTGVAGRNDICVCNPGATSCTNITNHPADDNLPDLSPDRTRIVFESGRNGPGNIEIYRINVDGTGLVRLTNGDGLDVEPKWSPDGTQIYFQSTRNGNQWQYFVMNADGSNQQVVQ